MELLDGKKRAEEFQLQLKKQILSQQLPRAPGLAAILVGEHPASKIYVRKKREACESIGIYFELVALPQTVSQQELESVIMRLNQSDKIDGILVQLPLPEHIDGKRIILAIDPLKDVDGFHPTNIGKVSLGWSDGFVPCTPLGIMDLLRHYDISLEGKNVTIIGRSHIVGKPLASLMSQPHRFANASVTLVHSKSRDIGAACLSADVIVACCGQPRFLKKEMVKLGAIVVDVGISRVVGEDGKSKIVGDVDFENVKNQCSWITPVPGGIGPMTIAMLLHNVWKSFSLRCGLIHD